MRIYQYSVFAASLIDVQIPNTLHEALQKPEWKKAIKDGIRAFVKIMRYGNSLINQKGNILSRINWFSLSS